MKIEVLFFAELGEIFGSHRWVDAGEGTTVGDIADIFFRESERFLLKKDFLVYAVNENFETPDKKLAERDRVAIMTPMSGG
jgi:molybdopterin converting factor small subunit